MSKTIKVKQKTIEDYSNIDGQGVNSSAMRRNALQYNEIDIEYNNPRELFRKLTKFVESRGFYVEHTDYASSKSEIGGTRGSIDAWIIGSIKKTHNEVLYTPDFPYLTKSLLGLFCGIIVLLIAIAAHSFEMILFTVVFIGICGYLFRLEKPNVGNATTYQLYKIYLEGEVEERWHNEERNGDIIKTAQLQSNMTIKSSCEYYFVPTTSYFFKRVQFFGLKNLLVTFDLVQEDLSSFLSEKGTRITEQELKELRENFSDSVPKLANIAK